MKLRFGISVQKFIYNNLLRLHFSKKVKKVNRLLIIILRKIN